MKKIMLLSLVFLCLIIGYGNAKVIFYDVAAYTVASGGPTDPYYIYFKITIKKTSEEGIEPVSCSVEVYSIFGHEAYYCGNFPDCYYGELSKNEKDYFEVGPVYKGSGEEFKVVLWIADHSGTHNESKNILFGVY